MSIYDGIEPLSLEKVETYSLKSRPSKVSVADFASPVSKTDTLSQFLEGLPNILAVQTLRNVAAQVRRARELGKPIIWGMGGHVIKTGLAPLIIDLMKQGYVTAIAGNGSVLVHDSEIAQVGSTSEDVDATLGEGAFGAAEETGTLLNRAAIEGARDRIGLGEAMGRHCWNSSLGSKKCLCCARHMRCEFPSLLILQSEPTSHIFIQALMAQRLGDDPYGFPVVVGNRPTNEWWWRVPEYRICGRVTRSVSEGNHAGS